LQPGVGFFVPVGLQFAVGGGEFGRQGRIEYYRQFVADDLFEFVQQLLSSSDAEGRDEYGALVLQGAVYGGFQAVFSVFPAFVVTVAVGAFEDQYVSFFRRLWCRQQRCVASAEVATKYDAGAVVVNLYIGGAEYVAGPLQANVYPVFRGVYYGVPLVIGQWQQALFDGSQVFFDQLPVAADAELEGVFQYQGQQFGRGPGADNGPGVAGGQ